MNDSIIIIIMEILGTVAFAVSGSLIAVKGGLDLFGVIFVGCITAFGGGILRDVLMGQIPPSIFSNTRYLALAAATCILTFILSYIRRKTFQQFQKRVEAVNNIFDAIGLAAFTVIGVEKAVLSGFYGYPVFAVAMGFLTGVGGGIIRDVLVDKTPYILRKHVYAVASLLGGCTYFIMRTCVDKAVAVSVSVALIIIIRLLATKFHWKLPKINFES